MSSRIRDLTGALIGVALSLGVIALGASSVAAAHAHHGTHRAIRHPAKIVRTKWVTSIPGKKTADLLVIGALGAANGGENFDGYSNGKPIIAVPLGWTVHVTFKNEGGLVHSLVFEPSAESESIPNPKPVFPGAESPNPFEGTQPGAVVHFTFRATKAGKYKFICAVPGHAAIGMWGTFIVVKGAKGASVKL